MQPYFFPHLGYFDLINYADRWIVFDTVKYIRHGWVNRNRVLHPSKGWQYITVPLLKHSSDTAISNIRIKEDSKWRRRIPGQLQHYRKHAPHYDETISLVEHCLTREEQSLSVLNVSILEAVCKRLRIAFRPEFFSRMDLDVGGIRGPGDWALHISEALGADEYVNPPGGEGIFDKVAFKERNVKLTIREIPPMQYRCARYEFIPRLSIVDVLMWNSKADVSAYLEAHRGH